MSRNEKCEIADDDEHLILVLEGASAMIKHKRNDLLRIFFGLEKAKDGRQSGRMGVVDMMENEELFILFIHFIIRK